MALNLRPGQRWSVGLTGIAVGLIVLSPLRPLLLVPAGAVVAAYFTCCGLGAAWALFSRGVDPERTGG